MGKNGQHIEFGELLTKLRLEASINKQSDLAKLLKTTQQTVSRWESGHSRPRAKQMSLIAAVLNIDSKKLLSAAGYISKPTVTSFDQPFPVDALTPDSFERICFYFLAKLHPTANVHRAGGTGHTQDGLDIDAIFPDGTIYTFQCKRVQQFGPKDVHVAVAKHTRTANKKFLLLSRVASPQAREAIQRHKTWDIWDTEDISREIRQNLPKNEQVKLVDLFFPGQRLALLGEREAGPWQTTEQFFEPFMADNSAFTHKWALVCRTKEKQNVVAALTNPKTNVVFFVGAGGAGKSRILKEAIEAYQAANTSAQVSFLSPRKEITEKSLEDLGDKKKILVVDDAHDEDNLQILFQYVASPSSNAKLLLALRPYGLDYIKTQASCFALNGDHIDEIKLGPLNISQATELAKQVLINFNGPEIAAEHIARVTFDCPLATVIGAQIVAKEKINYLELLKNEEVFRTTIFGKFRDIIAGDIGRKGDDEPIRKLLNILALIQPFHPDDNSVANLIEQIEGVRAHEAKRLIHLLVNAGVLFKRGGLYRLSPDLLSDFIIEDSCIGFNGLSTGYAEAVFDGAGNPHTKNILLNLGKLDWRRADGNPSNSKLLDGIWQKLKPTQEYSDPCIEAVNAVAYYQPDRALLFAEQLIREGQYLNQIPDILKHAAYNLEHLQSACELLWVLGRGDDRQLGQNPGHAIRLLSEMCAVERNKPFEYNEAVVDFALSLMKDNDSWNYTYTPFDILKSILATEGSFTESHGVKFSFGNFPINYSFVAPLRDKVISSTLHLLSSARTKVAVLAARFIGEGIRYYSRLGDHNHHNAWKKAYIKTLNDIEAIMCEKNLDPLVQIEIARSVKWHANYGKNKTTTPIAKRIIKSLPNTLEFRTILILIDGFGSFHEGEDYKLREQRFKKQLDSLVTDLHKAYPDGERLRTFIEEHLSHIALNFGGGNSSPYILYGNLIQKSLSLAKATANDALANPTSRTVQFTDMALSKLLTEDHEKALDLAYQFLDANSRELSIAVGRGFSCINVEDTGYGEKDLLLLKKILSSKDELVAKSAISAVRSIAKNDQKLAINLLRMVDIGMSNDVADDTLVLFQKDEMIPFNMLKSDEIDFFLGKLMRLSELNGYWIEIFLSKCSKYHPNQTAAFFMSRVEHSAKTQNWKYQPCNYGPYGHVSLRFRESSEFVTLLRQVAQWMKDGPDDYLFKDNAARLFDTMFKPFDDEVIEFLHDWVAMAASEDIRVISRILREESSIVF